MPNYINLHKIKASIPKGRKLFFRGTTRINPIYMDSLVHRNVGGRLSLLISILTKVQLNSFGAKPDILFTKIVGNHSFDRLSI